MQREIPNQATLDAIADDSGLAIAVVDSNGMELFTANDNSICRALNPTGQLVRECSAFCGLALAEINETGARAEYTCHAGLECRASAMHQDGNAMAVIVGRAFTNADNYRNVTERAISGDWQEYAPASLFENVLLTTSTNLIESTLDRIEAEGTSVSEEELVLELPPVSGLEKLVDDFGSQTKASAHDDVASGPADIRVGPEKASPTFPVDPLALRCFFSSILSKDYLLACETFLELIAASYFFTSLVWLERKEGRFTSVAAVGPLKNRRLIMNLLPDDARLSEAVASEYPVRLTEDSGGLLDQERTMYVFPVPVGDDILSVLTALGSVENDDILHHISRLCLAVGPQVEILRLRGEVAQKDALANAVKRFSDGLKNVDSEDPWLSITQVAAELMQAERGSLLVLNEQTNQLEIKAAVGVRGNVSSDASPGNRVARTILERGKPAAIANVDHTGLPPFPAERGYKTHSFLSGPISLAGRNLAVINFTDKASGEAFGKAELALLEEIAPQIAAAIDRAILKEKAGEFQKLSVTDSLTGLLNRRYMDERLLEEVKRSRRHGYPMSFVLLDVDNFKTYNDQFGHPAGDDALKILAQVLRDTLRGADVAARYGGEEFAILLPQTNSDEASVIAERLRANVEAATFPYRAVTISVGVATCYSDLCTNAGLILASDNALYKAKDGGRNRVYIHGEIQPDA
ncbi:MAG: diguanylate cyclase [Acidobacteriota bacterium]